MKHLAQGFAVMMLLIWVLNVISLVRAGNAWLGLLYFLVLLIPLFGFVFLWGNRSKDGRQVGTAEKWGGRLFSLHGVALACWAFDIATTYYAIDVAKVATEENPLGWPLGVLGALIYYVPTLVSTYVLLFKQRQRLSLYTAVAVTVLTLCMGSMNLNAGLANFGFFITTASLTSGLRYSLLGLVAAADLICLLAFARLFGKQFLRSREKPSQTGSSLP